MAISLSITTFIYTVNNLDHELSLKKLTKEVMYCLNEV